MRNRIGKVHIHTIVDSTSSAHTSVRLTDEPPVSGGLEPNGATMNAFTNRLGAAGLTILISVSILSFTLAAWNMTTFGA